MDYSADIDFAQEAVREYGRSLTMVKDNAAINNISPLDPPDAEPVRVDNIYGVQIEPGSTVNLGGAFGRLPDLSVEGMELFVVASDPVYDWREFTAIDDKNINWKIKRVKVLQPGDEVILYYIYVVR